MSYFFRLRDDPTKIVWFHCPIQEGNTCSWRKTPADSKDSQNYFRVDFTYNLVVIANNSLGTVRSLSDPVLPNEKYQYETKSLGTYEKVTEFSMYNSLNNLIFPVLNSVCIS